VRGRRKGEEEKRRKGEKKGECSVFSVEFAKVDG